MPLTFGQLKADLRPLLFPAGEPKNLRPAHDRDFLDAIIDLQTWVECLQQDNTSLIPHCATLYKCGLTTLEAPRGMIKSLDVIDKSHLLASGNVTASKTATIVESSSAFFDSTMVGSLIRFEDGQTFTIAYYVDPSHVAVINKTPSGDPLLLGTNVRINALGNLELYDPDDQLWHEVTLAGPAGDVQIALNQMGVQ